MVERASRCGDRINAIGRDVAAFYEPVVSDLQQVRMQARHFETSIATLKAGTKQRDWSGDNAGSKSVEEATGALRDAIRHSCDMVSDQRLHAVTRDMQAHCGQLLNQSRELNSLSFLMLVTTASGASSGFTVEHLVSDLRKMAESLKKAASDVIETLKLVDAERSRTAETLAKTCTLIDRSLEAFGRLHDASDQEPCDPESEENLRKMAEDLSRDLAKLLPDIVSCMQYPDAFAQRCDHMARATQIIEEEDLDPATDHALRSLISAQLEDICGELNRIQTDALHTLHRISERSKGTLATFRDHLDKDQRLGQISARQDRIEQTGKSLQKINEVAHFALKNLLECVEHFAGIEATFLKLDKMRQGVRSSALNADLSERQAKTNMPELRSVTKAVGDCASACGATIENLERKYEQLQHVFRDIDEGAINRAISSVEDRVSASKDELQVLCREMETIRQNTAECSDTLGRMTELGRSAQARIASNTMAAKQLDQIRQQIRDVPADAGALKGAPDEAVLRRVFDSYSIEIEREIHRKVLPDCRDAMACDETGKQAPEDDDPLAEFLF